MTAGERSNATTFIQYTTVRPFNYMGSKFKCFYCTQYYSNVNGLLDHTLTHEIDDRETILNKHIPRGKRTMLADISILKCRLCNQRCPDLDSVRQHLELEHGKCFRKAENGMTEYKMVTRDGVLQCHICEDTFHSFPLLSAHMYQHVCKVVCEVCGAGFPNRYLLSRHTENHISGAFACKHCDKVFLKRSQRKYHTEIVHKGKERVKLKKCEHCPLTFKEHYSKMAHLKRVHGLVENFPCRICDTQFSTRRSLTEHTTKRHTEKFKCEICSKCFGIESKLKQHVLGHSGTKNFVCPICNNGYMHKVTLKKHMRVHDTDKHSSAGRVRPTSSMWSMTLSERENAAVLLLNTTANPFTYLSYPFTFKCFYCSEKCSELAKLLEHSRSHALPDLHVLMKEYLKKGKKTIKADISELECRICGVSHSSLDEARSHLTTIHEKRFTEAGNGIIAFSLKVINGVYSCHTCSETFNSFFSLNKHINIHYSNAICDTCGKGFATHARLMQHKETHVAGRYPCGECARTFTSPPKLRYHVARVHGRSSKVKPSKCHLCDSRFEHHYEKVKHLREEHGVSYNHPCKACSDVFATRKSLYFHTRKHHISGLSCEVCARPFAERNHLTKHMAVHTQLRTHHCPLCTKAYRHEKNLKDHMRSHNPDWRFACPRCWVGFRGKIEYRNHMEIHK